MLDATFLSIAKELTEKMPEVFCGHNLEQAWAYKYDQDTQAMYDGASGISMHADRAMINVNFWIGEEQEEGAERGGMVVYLREAPLEWSFEQYQSKGPHQDKFLGKGTVNQAANLTVAHRPNRMVMFRSNLFHGAPLLVSSGSSVCMSLTRGGCVDSETDVLHFKPGFKNRRINFTLLFGIRGGHKSEMGKLCGARKEEL
jgi:hypothetical protein